MVKFIFIFAFIFFLYISVAFRILCGNPFKSIYYFVRDFYSYIKFKKWRVCKSGRLVCYTGLFGKGKTLSAVHEVVRKYNKYNNKKIYDFERKQWVTQVIHIISNVELSIPYEYFVSLEQVVRVSDKFKTFDEMYDTLTCTIVLGDEFSVQMNSRDFKKNIDALFLNTLLTCRHHHIELIYTAQRFNHVDALLRQVTSYVVECSKSWRFMQHYFYDAFALENATEPSLVKPYKTGGFFVRNKDFNAYDTLACVGNLKKSFNDNDMMSEEEILNLQMNNGVNMDAVLKPSRKYRKVRKRMK